MSQLLYYYVGYVRIQVSYVLVGTSTSYHYLPGLSIEQGDLAGEENVVRQPRHASKISSLAISSLEGVRVSVCV